MTSQGPNNGSSFSGWTDSANAQYHDGIYASTIASPFISTPYLKSTGFGFSIPAGSTINGIVVGIEKKAQYNPPGPYVVDETINGVLIVKGDTEQGTNHYNSNLWPTTETYFTYGSSSDLWGLSWVPSDINSSGFGVSIRAYDYYAGSGYYVYIDHVRITVYYTIPTASITVTSSSATGAGYVSVDGDGITTPHVYTWTTGDTHTLAASSTVDIVSGQSRYAYTSWSDSGAQSHTYTVPGSDTTVTANFHIEYYFLVTDTVDSATGQNWYDSGTTTVSSSVTRPVSCGSGCQRDTLGFTGTGSCPSSSTPSVSTTGNFTITQYSTVTWNWFTTVLADRQGYLNIRKTVFGDRQTDTLVRLTSFKDRQVDALVRRTSFVDRYSSLSVYGYASRQISLEIPYATFGFRRSYLNLLHPGTEDRQVLATISASESRQMYGTFQPSYYGYNDRRIDLLIIGPHEDRQILMDTFVAADAQISAKLKLPLDWECRYVEIFIWGIFEEGVVDRQVVMDLEPYGFGFTNRTIYEFIYLPGSEDRQLYLDLYAVLVRPIVSYVAVPVSSDRQLYSKVVMGLLKDRYACMQSAIPLLEYRFVCMNLTAFYDRVIYTNLIKSDFYDEQIYAYVFDSVDRQIALSSALTSYDDRQLYVDFGGIRDDRQIDARIVAHSLSDRQLLMSFEYLVNNEDRWISSNVALPLWESRYVLTKVGLTDYANRVLYLVRRGKLISEITTKASGSATSVSPATKTTGSTTPESATTGTGSASQESVTKGSV